MMQYHDVRENQILALCVCTWFHGFPRSIVNIHDAIVFTLTGFSEEPSSSHKRLPTIFCEQDVFSCSASFSVRSQIGLGLDWVGLEDSARGASPSDCWTNFPIGRCSTVKPDLFLYSNWDRASKRSSVVDEETSIAFHTISLHFSIFQLLQCNGLEVFLEE